MVIFITSGKVDNIFLGCLLAAAIAMFAVISKAREGFLIHNLLFFYLL